MKRRFALQALAALGGSFVAPTRDARGEDTEDPALRIELDAEEPSRSRASFAHSPAEFFPVGLGRKGFLPEGERFRGDYSLLGTFSVNAILGEGRFEMTDRLVTLSGKPREWLAERLFDNMNSIDFDGDGRGGEYGAGYVSLEPLGSELAQPFHFGEYKGVFRWYSYAIHGTADEARVGRRSTGGCINVAHEILLPLLERIRLGDRVLVSRR